MFTCFSNDGGTLLSENKFTWSQGVFCGMRAVRRRSSAAGCVRGCRPLLAHAKQTADFLLNHAFLDNGHCAFLLDRHGNKLEMKPGEDMTPRFTRIALW